MTLVLLVLAVLAGAALAASPSQARGASYNWPVEPFNREHPVRGLLGDPRTIFAAPATTEGVLTGGGEFQFHFGVDISAPDGAAVYPVVSGTVVRRRKDNIVVSCGGGRTFEYWHITPAVGVGSRVTAYETVLGRIIRPTRHVHLSELLNGVYVNPLEAGHLTPYTDREAPRVAAITFHASPGVLAVPNFVHGRVDLVVEAYDTPNRPVPGIWRDMPVSPALITWSIRDLRPRTVVRTTVAVDFRHGIPGNADFWRVYERGSFQNMSVFGNHYSYRQPGRYLYRLSRSAFDTRRLENGVYDLVVTVGDIRGNASTATLRFTVSNGAGAGGA